MKKSKKQVKEFSGMGYRQVQKSNSIRKKQLPKNKQIWLKANGYKNIGWDQVIKLYQKLNELFSDFNDDELSLEELFLEADRLGQKYQTKAEIENFHQEMTTITNEIANLIDQQFPETEIEIIDYTHRKSPNKY